MQAAEDVVHAVQQGGCPAVAVVGSKGVGKSTLARLLVNSLLERNPVVAYLDTDCGQSEFTVPGQYKHLLESVVRHARPTFLRLSFLANCIVAFICTGIIDSDWALQTHSSQVSLHCPPDMLLPDVRRTKTVAFLLCL